MTSTHQNEPSPGISEEWRYRDDHSEPPTTRCKVQTPQQTEQRGSSAGACSVCVKVSRRCLDVPQSGSSVSCILPPPPPLISSPFTCTISRACWRTYLTTPSITLTRPPAASASTRHTSPTTIPSIIGGLQIQVRLQPCPLFRHFHPTPEERQTQAHRLDRND